MSDEKEIVGNATFLLLYSVRCYCIVKSISSLLSTLRYLYRMYTRTCSYSTSK